MNVTRGRRGGGAVISLGRETFQFGNEHNKIRKRIDLSKGASACVNKRMGEQWGSGEGKVFIWQVLPFQHDLWKENCNFVPIPLTLPHLSISLPSPWFSSEFFAFYLCRHYLDIFFFDLSST